MLGEATLVDVPNPASVISDIEATQFREQGFVLPKIGLPDDEVANMSRVIEEVIKDNPDWHGIVRMPHVPKREGQLEGVVGGEKIFEIAMSPTLIAVARRLLGPDIIMWGSEMFAKPAGTGPRTPWHQDCYTPAVKAGLGHEFPKVISIWIAVDDVDPDNGSLSFIPGSGLNGKIDHGKFNKTVKELLNFEADTKEFDVNRAVHTRLKSGHYSIHDLYVVHGSNANTSGRRRVGLALHYMAATDIYDRSFGDAMGSGRSEPAPIARRPIWLVLGENRRPENDFAIGHENLEDLDALAAATRARLTPLLG